MQDIIYDTIHGTATDSYHSELIRTELMQAIQSIKDSVAAAKSAELAQTSEIKKSSFVTNNLWMMVATILVFIMHLGFATLESGLSRAKNTTNILFKNVIIPCIGLLSFALVGYSLMYPGFQKGVSYDYIGFKGFGIFLPEGGEGIDYSANYTFWTEFLFQGMFAATCATIVSGVVAERIKLISFIIFSALFVSFAYPIIGSWKWGNGWLNTIGFHDFAGSTLVHSVGGWAGLAAVLLLGPRFGKYEGNSIYPIPGHNMTSAVIGTFMLWLGWFGFNGGSVLSADPGEVSRVLVMTCLSACAGGIVASITIFSISKSFDLSMTLNGILAGLVSITAGADQMGVLDSIILGTVAGMIVVFSVMVFDRLRIDDPVGALSVHLSCGLWGTLAVGLFGNKAGVDQLIAQLTGMSAAGFASFVFSFIVFLILKYTIGIRISIEEEVEGLDQLEHGMEAYPNFLPK